MAIRLRRTKKTKQCFAPAWEAFCAAKTNAQPGDVYLDDAQHDALAEFYLNKLPSAIAPDISYHINIFQVARRARAALRRKIEIMW